MQQRDLLKDQIEQLGRVLGKVLADFMGFKADGLVLEGIQLSTERLKSELGLEVDALLELPREELKAHLAQRDFKEVHLEVLSELLVELGPASDSKDVEKAYFECALLLLDLADEVSQTMSFTRVERRRYIHRLLNPESKG